ncbi:MAG: hypothetical protein E6G08_00335 [Actinobacteria bacterium]|nr:MAG: hypothetical protein E6G08_00335 [Actinomycetota bacterium]
MGLAALTDALAAYLESTLEPTPALVGATYPTANTDLPAVVLSCSGARQQLRGIGRLPAPSATGALRVTDTVDLANPVATFPDAVVTLLSNDRKTLTLLHGPLVAADGTNTTFGSADLHATVGATVFSVVEGTPGAGEVQPDPDLGVLRFGAALPATGTLTASYFVGEWEVRTERYQGTLLVETFAADTGAVDTLSRAVEAALLEPAGNGPLGLNEIEPTSWLPIDAAGPNRASARGRALAFTFDYELVEPHVGAGGGLISTVSVDSTFGAEHFDVQREGSTP